MGGREIVAESEIVTKLSTTDNLASGLSQP